MADKEKKMEVPKIYTGVKTLSTAYSILTDVGIEGLITGKFDVGVDFAMLAKQYSGKASFSKKKVEAELEKSSSFIYDIVDKLLGDNKKLIELYEVVTKTKVTEADDPDIEIVLEALVNFFYAIVKKVPRFLAKMFILQKERI